MTTTTAALVWQDTTNAIYLRTPHTDPNLPHGGDLLGYAICHRHGWQIRWYGDGHLPEVPVRSRETARDILANLAGQ